MSLTRGRGVTPAGSTARLVSQRHKAPTVDSPQCISFWYFMHELFIDSAGSSLGSLRIYILTEDRDGDELLIPAWRLDNYQGQTWNYAQAPIITNKEYRVSVPGIILFDYSVLYAIEIRISTNIYRN